MLLRLKKIPLDKSGKMMPQRSNILLLNILSKKPLRQANIGLLDKCCMMKLQRGSTDLDCMLSTNWLLRLSIHHQDSSYKNLNLQRNMFPQDRYHMTMLQSQNIDLLGMQYMMLLLHYWNTFQLSMMSMMPLPNRNILQVGKGYKQMLQDQSMSLQDSLCKILLLRLNRFQQHT